MFPGAYGWLMLAGILVSALVWSRQSRHDPRLPIIYLGALIGTLIGAKVVYLLAEGWHDLGQPQVWFRLATGKTILGGLLFGYGAVELVKHRLDYREPTGDRFALIAPLGIAFGRAGCLLHGCCLGRPMTPSWYTLNDAQDIARWPSVPLEFAFNLLVLPLFWILRRTRRFPGQLFHLYLVAYGTFRFVHEFFRATPRLVGPFSGYHLAAALLVALGAFRYHQRARHPATRLPLSPAGHPPT